MLTVPTSPPIGRLTEQSIAIAILKIIHIRVKPDADQGSKYIVAAEIYVICSISITNSPILAIWKYFDWSTSEIHDYIFCCFNDFFPR